MDKLIKEVHEIIQIYNDNFIQLIVFLLLVIFIVGFCLYSNDKDRFFKYWTNIKYELIQMFVEFFLLFFLTVFLFEIFKINIITSLKFKLYGKMILGFWIGNHIKHLYDFNKYSAIQEYISKVKNCDCGRKPDIIFKEKVKNYEFLIEDKQEELALYKSFSPVALIVLVAGKIIDSVDMDKYIILFFCGIFFFFYKVLNCKKNLFLLRRDKYEVEIELKRYQTEEIKQEPSGK